MTVNLIAKNQVIRKLEIPKSINYSIDLRKALESTQIKFDRVSIPLENIPTNFKLELLSNNCDAQKIKNQNVAKILTQIEYIEDRIPKESDFIQENKKQLSTYDIIFLINKYLKNCYNQSKIDRDIIDYSKINYLEVPTDLEIKNIINKEINNAFPKKYTY